MIFDPSVTSDYPIEEAFRVFVNPSMHEQPPALQKRPGCTVPQEANTVCVMETPMVQYPRAGPGNMRLGYAECTGVSTWTKLVWSAPNDPNAPLGSGIVAAALYTTMYTPMDAPLYLVSNEPTLRNFLSKKRQDWEDQGWTRVQGAKQLRLLINMLWQCCAPTILQVLKEDECTHMKRAVENFRMVRREEEPPTEVEAEGDPAFELSGAKLSTLTQAQAYLSIRERKRCAPRPATVENIRRVLEHAWAAGKPGTTATDIWGSLCHCDIQRKIVDFIWKIVHSTHRVGRYWSKISGYKDRSMCSLCGVEESMEHILTDCWLNKRRNIWRFAQSLWEKKGLR